MHHSLGGMDQGVLVIGLPRHLDHDSAEPLIGVVTRHLPNRDDASAILDLSQVELISSIGVTALLQVREICNDRGAGIMLAAIPPTQMAFLKMLRLDTKFEIAETVEDALATLAAEHG